MFGLLRNKLKISESMLAATIKSAREAEDAAAPPAASEAASESGQRRDAYYCNDQGCWVAEQYFCDETGCYITGDAPAELKDFVAGGKVVPTSKKAAKSGAAPAPPEKVVVQEG